MAVKPKETRIVEAIHAFQITPDGPTIHPGERVWAWPTPQGWNVVFNGLDVPVAAGVVGELDSAEVKEAAEARKGAAEKTIQALAPPPPVPDPAPGFPEDDDVPEDFEEVERVEDEEDPPA